MGFVAWLRRMWELPSSRHAVEEREWGEVREWVEGDCRNVQWSALVDSWHELEPVVDQFLAASVDAVVAAHPAEHPRWIVLSFNPLTGMLSVAPATEPAWPDGGQRVELSLSSMFWELEAERTYNASTDGSFDPFYERVWGMVRACLRGGEASRRLSAARLAHPLRIAAFNYPTGCDDEWAGELAGSGDGSDPKRRSGPAE